MEDILRALGFDVNYWPGGDDTPWSIGIKIGDQNYTAVGRTLDEAVAAWAAHRRT